MYDARRAPSWTDRILWRSNYLLSDGSGAAVPPVTQTGYAAVEGMRQSDHRPVVASFEVQLKHSAHVLLDETVDTLSAYGTGASRGPRKWLGKARPAVVAPILSVAPLRENAAMW